jgi:hypothetical protein
LHLLLLLLLAAERMQRKTLYVRRLWQLKLDHSIAVGPCHERNAGNWQQLTDWSQQHPVQ